MLSSVRPVLGGLSHSVFALVSVMLCTVSLSAQQVAPQSSVRSQARVSPDVVSLEQLRAHPDLLTAFMVVEALHSNWLRERGVRPLPAQRVPVGGRSVAGENGGVQVYLDGHRLGGPELLRAIPAAGVYSMRHLNGIEAQGRFGAGHSEGVILIATGASWDRAR